MSRTSAVLAGLSSELAQLLRHNDLTSLGLTLSNEEISLSDLRKMSDKGYESFLDDMKVINVNISDARTLYDALQGEGAADGDGGGPGPLTNAMTDEITHSSAKEAAKAAAREKAQAKRETHFSHSPLSYDSWQAGVDPSSVKKVNTALRAYQTRQTAEERQRVETVTNSAAHKGTLIVAPEHQNNSKVTNINKNNVGSWFV